MNGNHELLLAIDTSGSEAGLVLAGDGRVSTFFLQAGPAGAARTEDLAGSAARLLAERGATASGLTAVAAVVGPGSYTGLRSGLAFLRGLSFADSLPAVAVGTLELLAWRGARAGESAVAVSDAGSGRYAVAVYRREDSDVRETAPPRLVSGDECDEFLAAEGAGSVVVLPVPCGSQPAFSRIEEAAHRSGNALRPAEGNPLEALAALAGRRVLGAKTVSAGELLPIYVGQSAARPNRNRVAVPETPE